MGRSGGVLCYITYDGVFDNGYILDMKSMKNLRINEHPDTGARLQGQIPLWNKIVEAVNEFAIYFPQLDYLGFDFVITSDNKVKMLEINSLTSLDGIQLVDSIFEHEAGDFYKKRILK